MPSFPKKPEEASPLLPSQKAVESSIDPGEAMLRIAYWRTIMKRIVGESYTRAVYIPIDDLRDILSKFPEAKGVRAYLGLTTLSAYQEVHLYIVPAADKNTDIIPMAKLGGGVDPLIGTGVYDFTQPCPNQCDVNSPYYDPPEP